MSSSVAASIVLQFGVTKTFPAVDPTAAPPSLPQNLFPGSQNGFSMNLNGSSPDPLKITDSWSGTLTLVAGVLTIDLTSLTQLNFGSVSMSGKKLKVFQILANSGNAGPITIGTGGTNGYPGLGVISQIQPGDPRFGVCNAAVAVGGSAKTLDLSGTGTDSLTAILTFGP